MWLSSDVRASGFWAVILKGTNFGIKPVQATAFFWISSFRWAGGLGQNLPRLGGWTRAQHITRCDLFPLWSKYIWFVYYELNNQWLKQTQKDLNILFLSASFSFNAVNVFFIFCQFLTWIILNITIWWINSSSLHFFEFY